MSDDDLTFVQRSALVTLMVEAQEVPNSHLVNIRKLDLKKQYRDPLAKAGLINVKQERKGRPLMLELTDKGWHRAIAEIGAGAPKGSGSGGAMAYAILDAVRRFLDRSNLSAQEFFTTPVEAETVVEPSPDMEARIRKAYGEVASRTGAWVMLAKVRAALGPAARAEVDATLVRLSSAPDVQLIPESNQKVLTAEERAAAVSIGNQDNHLISIGS